MAGFDHSSYTYVLVDKELTIGNLNHNEEANEVGASPSTPAHAERKKVSRLAMSSARTGTEERLQDQCRNHHEKGHLLGSVG